MQGVKPAADSVFGMDAPFDGLTRLRHVQLSRPVPRMTIAVGQHTNIHDRLQPEVVSQKDVLTDRFWPAADRRHPAPTGCFAPRSGRADQKSEMRSRMTADG